MKIEVDEKLIPEGCEALRVDDELRAGESAVGWRGIGPAKLCAPFLIVRLKPRRQWLVEETPLHTGGADFTALEGERVHIRIVHEVKHGTE